MIGLPGPEHVIFIPLVLLIGVTIGWVLGGRAARRQMDARQRRARE